MKVGKEEKFGAVSGGDLSSYSNVLATGHGLRKSIEAGRVVPRWELKGNQEVSQWNSSRGSQLGSQ